MIRMVLSSLLLLLCFFQPAVQQGRHDDEPTKPLKANGRIRLVGGSSSAEGNVFVESTDGNFYPVCDDHWGVEEATVACRQLGYTYQSYTKYSKFGRVSSSFAMDDVYCSGSESTLQSCRSSQNENCWSDEAAGVVCTSAAPSPTCSCGISNSNRIVGGENAQKNEFPWQVEIYHDKKGHFCGGTLISSRDILTAAHCVEDEHKEYLRVVIKEHNLKLADGEETVSFSIDNIITHDKYDDDAEDADYDYAIIQLDNSLSFSTSIRPACLPTTTSESFYENKVAIASGWGSLYFRGPYPDILQKVELETMTNSACCDTNRYNYTCGEITPRMICASGPGKDSCSADSGGPLVVRDGNGYYTLVGVTSWGYGCGSEYAPGVYARVTDQLSWIKANMVDRTCI